jgi:hypothetical protein
MNGMLRPTEIIRKSFVRSPCRPKSIAVTEFLFSVARGEEELRQNDVNQDLK